MRRGRRSAWLLVGLLVAACGEHRVQPPVTTPAAPAAQLVISEDFGAHVLRTERVAPDQSVMAALQGAAKVSTTYGGRFVQSIDGTSGSQTKGADWLYFVNGVEADVGASDWKLRTGDTTWWDYRRWHAYPHVPAVVGSWPEPFVHGVRAAPASVAADPPLDAPLKAAGAPVGGAASAPFRVLVGADRELRARDADWRRAVDQPRSDGLTAWVDGSAAFRFNADGNDNVVVPDGKAVAAATATTAGGVVLAVTGVDAPREAAAAAIARDPALLAHRYAVVFDGSRRAGRATAVRREAAGLAPLAIGLLAIGVTTTAFAADDPFLIGACLLADPAARDRARSGAACSRHRVTTGLAVAMLNPFVSTQGDLILINGPTSVFIDLQVTLEEASLRRRGRRPAGRGDDAAGAFLALDRPRSAGGPCGAGGAPLGAHGRAGGTPAAGAAPRHDDAARGRPAARLAHRGRAARGAPHVGRPARADVRGGARARR